MFIRERAMLGVSNPVIDDFSKPVTEALVSDLKIKEVRAIYPLIRAINSGRLTRNYTLYPAESLIGKYKKENPSGYSSFAKPYGKPIIREHQAQNVPGLLGPVETADVPMGRVVFAGFKRRVEKRDGPATPPSKAYIPGTVEGDGAMYLVPAITHPEAISNVLGGAFHTVSIGSNVENVWESISGENIALLRRQGKELPAFERGQLYDGKLSYWRMGEVKGVECSFVNVPSDEYAGVVDPDIGSEGIRLLVAEKKTGKTNEFNFFDAKTAEKIDLGFDESVFDESFFIDSAQVGQNIWWLSSQAAEIMESAILEAATEEYHCTDHPDKKSKKQEDCPVCGKQMTKIEEDDEESSLATDQEGDVTTMWTIDEIKKSIEQDEIVYNDSLEVFADKLAKGESLEGYEISDEDSFRSLQDLVTEHIGDWTLEAAKLAVALFTMKEGTVTYSGPLVESNDTNIPVTLGSVYLLPEDHEDFAKVFESSIEASEGRFAGEDKTYPVNSTSQALRALKYLEVSTTDKRETILENVLKLASAYGIGKEENNIVLYPLMVENTGVSCVPLFTIRNTEDIKEFLVNLPNFTECYGLTEQEVTLLQEKMVQAELFYNGSVNDIESREKSGENVSVGGFYLNTAHLVHYLIRNETSQGREDLAMLVGLIRKNNLSKEDITQAQKAYNVFGTAVLRKLLVSVPETTEKSDNTAPTDGASTNLVEQIPDPVAATEEVKSTSQKSPSDILLGTRVRSNKKTTSGNNPIKK